MNFKYFTVRRSILNIMANEIFNAYDNISFQNTPQYNIVSCNINYYNQLEPDI